MPHFQENRKGRRFFASDFASLWQLVIGEVVRDQIATRENDVEIAKPRGSRGRERYLVMWGGNVVCGLQCAVGPAQSFRSVGPSLRLGPRGQEAARYRDGLWINRKTGGRFPCLWIETASLLRLENPLNGQSLTLGTFGMIGVMGNTVYAERENSHAVATLNERSGLWETCRDQRAWSDLTVQPAASVGGWPAGVFAELPNLNVDRWEALAH
ncbi:MAG TPA: hypothetical protein VHD36_10815 [Pirellulales bacterium]|nr:hypothetical protein [Pirellulales bacterium]